MPPAGPIYNGIKEDGNDGKKTIDVCNRGVYLKSV
jgi:hypothetical protein